MTACTKLAQNIPALHNAKSSGLPPGHVRFNNYEMGVHMGVKKGDGGQNVFSKKLQKVKPLILKQNPLKTKVLN